MEEEIEGEVTRRRVRGKGDKSRETADSKEGEEVTAEPEKKDGGEKETEGNEVISGSGVPRGTPGCGEPLDVRKRMLGGTCSLGGLENRAKAKRKR